MDASLYGEPRLGETARQMDEHAGMEIYVQEVEAITYLPSLTAAQRELLETMAASFPVLLYKAASLVRAGIPFQAWYFFLADPRSS